MITLYIAQSIDGYIATPDGSVDWLSPFEGLEEDYGYKVFLDTVDTLIIGRKTFDQIVSFGVWPFFDKKVYVLSRNNAPENIPEGVTFFKEFEEIKKVMEVSKGNAWLVGGGEIIKLFLESSSIDELILSTIPVMLGDGIPLFPKGSYKGNWSFSEIKTYKNGLITAIYNKS
ncbi:MAG: dihydrofolate reductase family protein [Candidatus Gracilibacteria bacterium]